MEEEEPVRCPDSDPPEDYDDEEEEECGGCR